MTANLKDVREALQCAVAEIGAVITGMDKTCCNDRGCETHSADQDDSCDRHHLKDTLYAMQGRAAAVLSQMETPAPQSGWSPVGVPRAWIEELARYRVADARGSWDVPGFDACVTAEVRKMIESASKEET